MDKGKISDCILHKLKSVPYLRIVNLRYLYLEWEHRELRKILKTFKVDCVFDVGANHGQYALMLRKKAKYKGLIISFEPMPKAAAVLRKLSKNDPLWIVEECALSTANGEQTFNIMSNEQFSSFKEPCHDVIQLFKNMNIIKSEMMVKTETLDSAFTRHQKKFNFLTPFLKMDTQGYDVEIVKNGKKVIKEFIGLQSELSIKKLYENSVNFKEAITLYEDCGFSLSSFIPNNPGFFPQLIEIDCLMVRNDLMNSSL